MKSYQPVATMLIVVGVLALSYGGFTFTKDTYETNRGPLSLSVEKKERVNIPAWAGLGGILTGSLLFVCGRFPR